MIDQWRFAKTLGLKRSRNGQGLDDAQYDGQVARVLRDLATTEFAFFRKPLEIGKHHGHQLQDDGRGDIRHDAERENGHAPEIAAAEQIEDAQNRAGSLIEQLVQHGGVDAGDGNVRTNPVHRQEGQREEHTIPQVFDAEHVLDCFKESVHTSFLNCRLRYHLKRAACLGNLFLRRGAERVRVNGQLGFQLAIAEYLDGIRGAADKSMSAKQFRRDRLACRENIELFQIYDGIADAKRVVKTALRHAPVQRHLAAFKTAAA